MLRAEYSLRRGAPPSVRYAELARLLDEQGLADPTVADVREAKGPNVINREQVERKIVVMCNVAGRDVASVVNDIQRQVNPIIAALEVA